MSPNSVSGEQGKLFLMTCSISFASEVMVWHPKLVTQTVKVLLHVLGITVWCGFNGYYTSSNSSSESYVGSSSSSLISTKTIHILAK